MSGPGRTGRRCFGAEIAAEEDEIDEGAADESVQSAGSGNGEEGDRN